MKTTGLMIGFIVLALTPEVHAQTRVAMSTAMKSVVTKVQPDYSPVARQMKVAGKVEVDVIIAADGSVEEVKVVSGNPLLTSSAVTAVKKWKFTPFEDGGKPVRAVTTLNFDFRP